MHIKGIFRLRVFAYFTEKLFFPLDKTFFVGTYEHKDLPKLDSTCLNYTSIEVHNGYVKEAVD
jgi:hypothetical protein